MATLQSLGKRLASIPVSLRGVLMILIAVIEALALLTVLLGFLAYYEYSRPVSDASPVLEYQPKEVAVSDAETAARLLDERERRLREPSPFAAFERLFR